MALLRKIKQKLGIGSGDDTAEQARTEAASEPEPEVTIEHESSTETENGDAADDEPIAAETDAADDEPIAAETDAADDEPIAAETDAAASTGSLVDEEESTADPTEAAEPAEAAGPESEDIQVAGEDSEPVESIKGIGPAYAERLASIGIDSVADLAAADPAAVTEETGVGEKRASTWIERAKEF